MVYLISYDLNKNGQKYDDLYALIEEVSNGDNVHLMQSSWAIKSTQTVTEIFNILDAALDENDLLLITELTKNHFGRLTEDDWSKLNDLFASPGFW
jgi:hypothetical protein